MAEEAALGCDDEYNSTTPGAHREWCDGTRFCGLNRVLEPPWQIHHAVVRVRCERASSFTSTCTECNAPMRRCGQEIVARHRSSRRAISRSTPAATSGDRIEPLPFDGIQPAHAPRGVRTAAGAHTAGRRFGRRALDASKDRRRLIDRSSALARSSARAIKRARVIKRVRGRDLRARPAARRRRGARGSRAPSG